MYRLPGILYLECSVRNKPTKCVLACLSVLGGTRFELADVIALH